MTWGAVAGAVVSVYSASQAGDAAQGAADTAAQAQMAELDYLKETEKPVLELRNQALDQLQGYYNLPGERLSWGQIMPAAERSPYAQFAAEGADPSGAYGQVAGNEMYAQMQRMQDQGASLEQAYAAVMQNLDPNAVSQQALSSPMMQFAMGQYDQGSMMQQAAQSPMYAAMMGQIRDTGMASQEELLGQAKESAIYEQIMGERAAGEEAILRTAGATGGLRSGAAIADVTGFGQDLQQRALAEGYSDAEQREYFRAEQEAQNNQLRLDAALGAYQAQQGDVAGRIGVGMDLFGDYTRMGQYQAGQMMDFYGLQQGETLQDMNLLRSAYTDEMAYNQAVAAGGLQGFDQLRQYQEMLRNEQTAGVGGLANINLNTNQIGNVMSGIGMTQAQGQVAQGQIQADMWGNLSNAAATGISAYLGRDQAPAATTTQPTTTSPSIWT